MDEARGRGLDAFERSIDLLVSRLRHKLGDDPRQPSLIQTVRGQGYLFNASPNAPLLQEPTLLHWHLDSAGALKLCYINGLDIGAPVAKLVNARDSKIPFREECRFDSDLGHHQSVPLNRAADSSNKFFV